MGKVERDKGSEKRREKGREKREVKRRVCVCIQIFSVDAAIFKLGEYRTSVVVLRSPLVLELFSCW